MQLVDRVLGVDEQLVGLLGGRAIPGKGHALALALWEHQVSLGEQHIDCHLRRRRTTRT